MTIKKPIEYAINACETMMRKYAAQDLPPKGHFHYHQGVFLSGVNKTYQLTGDERYINYIKGWIDAVFDEDGNPKDFNPATVDDIQPGILLYPLLDKTGDGFYKKALDSVIAQISKIPLTSEGAFWHNPKLTNQMWLDGLYMAGPICAEYAKRFNRPDLRDLTVKQIRLMFKNTKDSETGLLCHAWDEIRKAKWADPVTGRSKEFWGRSVGWVPVAVFDDADFMDKDAPGRDEIIKLATDLLTALCRYQSEDGRWYQVINKGSEPGNWLENSCSCLYVAALCKAVRLGYMDAKYLDNARKGFEGVIRSLEWDGDDILIGNVCIGTGVGDYEHYCKRPVSVNDLHGVGAFLLMCAEAERVL